jgi:hypothetical protein
MRETGNGNTETLPYNKVEPTIRAKALAGIDVDIVGTDKTDPQNKVWVHTARVDKFLQIPWDRLQDPDEIRNQLEERARVVSAKSRAVQKRRKTDRKTES